MESDAPAPNASHMLFPLMAALPQRTRMLARAGLAALLAAVLLALLHVVFGLAPGWETALRGPIPAAANTIAAATVVARARIEQERRTVWMLLAVTICCYAVASILWACWVVLDRRPPDPSVSDLFRMAVYPLSAAAVVVSSRTYASRAVSMMLRLDGVVAATGMLALSAAFIVRPLLAAAHRSHTGVETDLLYPMVDMVIGVLMVALLSVRGWRLDRKWILLIATYAFWVAADCVRSLQEIQGSTAGRSVGSLLYMVAFTCIAAAAWQPEVHPDGDHVPSWPALLAPALLTLAPPTILVYDHFTRVSLAALVLTWIAMLVAIARMSLGLRDALSFKRVERAALTDDLTELPNRRMFFTRLRQKLDSDERRGRALATLMLDLDNFKQLNDTLGHEAGDELLGQIGPRLTEAVGAHATVARLGGDEFGIVLEHDAGRVTAADAAQAVLESFNEPFEVHGMRLRLTASVGIATFPEDAHSPETLVKCADVAMYEAKRSRRGWEHYSAERDEYTRERLELSGELSAALETGEIEAAFQPIADTASRRIVGAEALVRWRRGDGSLRRPDEFLEAAELSGLSRPLTRRVLALALEQVRQWRAAGHELYVAVNATVADLIDEAFPGEIRAALAEHRLDPTALKIEVTESSIVSDPERIGRVLGEIRGLGVEIALDDFGTGYSSLSHLRELPVDSVKIDRSFVTHMCDDSTDAAIVYATIELAHRLNLHVVSEGVEDERTWEELRRLGSERLQGYALARPVEPDEFRGLLLEQAPLGPPRRRITWSSLRRTGGDYLADSQSLPTPASTASGGSIE